MLLPFWAPLVRDKNAKFLTDKKILSKKIQSYLCSRSLSFRSIQATFFEGGKQCVFYEGLRVCLTLDKRPKKEKNGRGRQLSWAIFLTY
jgi:hypothetical protein